MLKYYSVIESHLIPSIVFSVLMGKLGPRKKVWRIDSRSDVSEMRDNGYYWVLVAKDLASVVSRHRNLKAASAIAARDRGARLVELPARGAEPG